MLSPFLPKQSILDITVVKLKKYKINKRLYQTALTYIRIFTSFTSFSTVMILTAVSR